MHLTEAQAKALAKAEYPEVPFSAIARFARRGFTRQRLAATPDVDLMAERMFGPKKLAEIRAHIPYQPESVTDPVEARLRAVAAELGRTREALMDAGFKREEAITLLTSMLRILPPPVDQRQGRGVSWRG